MTPPLITVLMPVFNARTTLGRAVESVRAQVLRDWELLIVDDGSDDGSRGLAEEFVRHDSRIRQVSRAHGGH